MKVAVYTRVSSEGQAQDDKESLPGQREMQLELARRNGWEVFKVYGAPGYGGDLLEENPALMELLDDARARRFDALLVREFGRLLRDEMVQAVVLNTLADAGITRATGAARSTAIIVAAAFGVWVQWVAVHAQLTRTIWKRRCGPPSPAR